MKTFKKPTEKTLKDGVIAVAALTAGSMLSRGVSPQIPIADKRIAKAIVMGTSLLAAASYNGEAKDIVKPITLGVAAVQAVDLITDFAKTQMQRKAGANKAETFLYDTMGLAGGCGCQQHNSYATPSLNSPTPALVTWNEVYNGGAIEDISHEDVTAKFTGV